MKKNLDYRLIGPAYPFRGGIAETQHQLALALQTNIGLTDLRIDWSVLPFNIIAKTLSYHHKAYW